MTGTIFFVLIILAVLGSGLMAGVFFTFSVFVMRGLRRLSPAQGIAAMQAINVAVINPIFLGVFLGTALPCIGLAIAVLPTWHRPASACLLIGAASYVGGSIGVTLLFNVPRNNALAAVAPDSAAGAEVWRQYLKQWCAWNHVRTLACIAAATAFMLAEHPVWEAFISHPYNSLDPFSPNKDLEKPYPLPKYWQQ
jgi:uncharacterized membrane protein